MVLMVDRFGEQAVFADDDGHAIVDKADLLLGEIRLHRGDFGVTAPSVDRRAPCAVVFGEHEFGRRIVVDGDHKPVVRGILRQTEAGVAGERRVRVIAGDEQETVHVLRTAGAYHVDEGLVELVEQFAGRILMRGVREADLVAAIENQPMVVVGESGRDLPPKRGESGAYAKVVLFRGSDPAERSIAAIVMHVDDHVQAGLVAPIDRLLHGVHPHAIDFASGWVLPILPCHRNADGIESGLLDIVCALAGERLVEP